MLVLEKNIYNAPMITVKPYRSRWYKLFARGYGHKYIQSLLEVEATLIGAGYIHTRTDGDTKYYSKVR